MSLRRLPTLILLAAAALLVSLLPASYASAASLPLGKERFEFSVGGLLASSTTNWVRLGMYDFASDGTVSETHWHWSQSDRVTRAGTGFTASGCPTRDCQVMTAGGYQSTSAEKTMSGTYSVSDNTLRVTWSSGQWEEWTLSSMADGALAKATFVDSNYGANYGFGYGSNAAWSDRVPASTIAATDQTKFVHTYWIWKTTDDPSAPFIDHGDGSPFWVTSWSVCDGGQCLGHVISSSDTQYYVAPARAPTGHRRDTLWSWRTANADNRGEYCYTGNSHVKPMVQIVDDNGGFHGWVGVEASLNQSAPSQGVYADDIGVFQIAG